MTNIYKDFDEKINALFADAALSDEEQEEQFNNIYSRFADVEMERLFNEEDNSDLIEKSKQTEIESYIGELSEEKFKIDLDYIGFYDFFFSKNILLRAKDFFIKNSKTVINYLGYQNTYFYEFELYCKAPEEWFLMLEKKVKPTVDLYALQFSYPFSLIRGVYDGSLIRFFKRITLPEAIFAAIDCIVVLIHGKNPEIKRYAHYLLENCLFRLENAEIIIDLTNLVQNKREQLTNGSRKKKFFVKKELETLLKQSGGVGVRTRKKRELAFSRYLNDREMPYSDNRTIIPVLIWDKLAPWLDSFDLKKEYYLWSPYSTKYLSVEESFDSLINAADEKDQKILNLIKELLLKRKIEKKDFLCSMDIEEVVKDFSSEVQNICNLLIKQLKKEEDNFIKSNWNERSFYLNSLKGDNEKQHIKDIFQMVKFKYQLKQFFEENKQLLTLGGKRNQVFTDFQDFLDHMGLIVNTYKEIKAAGLW